MTSPLEWWFVRKVVPKFKHPAPSFTVATREEILASSFANPTTLEEDVWKFCARYPYNEGGFYWNGNELRYESVLRK